MVEVPKAVKVISLLGMLPYLFGVLATFKLYFINAGLNTFLLRLSTLYGALILTFLGGCLFGFECLKNEKPNLLRLWLAIIPTLWSLIALTATNFSASILAVGFLLVFELDRKFMAAGVVPDWWLSLRFPLTASVSLSLLIIGFSHGN